MGGTGLEPVTPSLSSLYANAQPYAEAQGYAKSLPLGTARNRWIRLTTGGQLARSDPVTRPLALRQPRETADAHPAKRPAGNSRSRERLCRPRTPLGTSRSCRMTVLPDRAFAESVS